MAETQPVKRALVEGPEWMGNWTEMSVEGLEQLGYKVDTIYSNRKPFHLKMLNLFGRLGLLDISKLLQGYYSLKIRSLLKEGQYDLYLSISGKLNSETLKNIRANGCTTKIIYWIGDVYNTVVQQKFLDLNKAIDDIDCIAFTDKKLIENLENDGFQKLFYLPFGVSERYHRHILDGDLQTDGSDYNVSFVGTCTPDREELISFLNEHLDEPVVLWGRGWNDVKFNCRGRLEYDRTLQVYAKSRISLNIHQRGIFGGRNMRYYEIPAVGGFQICEKQDGFIDDDFDDTIVTYESKYDLLNKIDFYLGENSKRNEIVRKARDICYNQCLYSDRFRAILAQISVK